MVILFLFKNFLTLIIVGVRVQCEVCRYFNVEDHGSKASQ